MRAFILLATCVVASMAVNFEIPEPYFWDESFRVFYEKLDEEHKGLFKGIYNLCQSPSDNTALTHLEDVIEKHFRHEEKMMKDSNYGSYESHREIHHNFEKDLKALSTPISTDSCLMAKNWLVNHIKGTDFMYKGKLQEM